MTQATPSAMATDWWYVRVHPGGASRMDAAVCAVLPWMRDQVERTSADRWFFIRYWDKTGHHLRLRMRTDPDAVDELHHRHDELLALVTGLPEANETPADLLPRGVPDASASVGVQSSIYSPEFEKYGGPEGVDLAEQIFTLDSAFHESEETAAWHLRSDRAAAAVDLMGALVERTCRRSESEQFWARHRARWGWQLHNAAKGDAPLGELLVAIKQGIDRAEPDLQRELMIEQHAHTLERLLRRYPESRESVLLHHLHMVINRFGYPPGVEAALGIIAAKIARSQGVLR
ncbi:hypothetical protein IEE94_14140 [Yimella sp. cx-573]|nr:hypothetical protein [Yimella sp. cx-573]